MNEAYIGSIVLFAGNFAPRGWALCQGQIIAIQQNTALFSILGTTYGGNGQTTFALPDLRGRAAVSAGQGPGLSDYQLGQVSGAESATLTINQMPAHNHVMQGSETAVSSDPKDNVPANESANRTAIYGTPDGTTMNSAFCGYSGGNQPVGLIQPVLALNYIICLEGIFPSRN